MLQFHRRAKTAAASRSGKARRWRGRRRGGGRRRRRKEGHLNLFQESRSFRAPDPQPVCHRQQQPNVPYTGGVWGLHTHPLLPLPPVRVNQMNARRDGGHQAVEGWGEGAATGTGSNTDWRYNRWKSKASEGHTETRAFEIAGRSNGDPDIYRFRKRVHLCVCLCLFVHI